MRAKWLWAAALAALVSGCAVADRFSGTGEPAGELHPADELAAMEARQRASEDRQMEFQNKILGV